MMTRTFIPYNHPSEGMRCVLKQALQGAKRADRTNKNKDLALKLGRDRVWNYKFSARGLLHY